MRAVPKRQLLHLPLLDKRIPCSFLPAFRRSFLLSWLSRDFFLAALLVLLCGPRGEIGILLNSRGSFWSAKAEGDLNYEIERLELEIQRLRSDFNRKVKTLNVALQKKETIAGDAQKEVSDAQKLLDRAKEALLDTRARAQRSTEL